MDPALGTGTPPKPQRSVERRKHAQQATNSPQLASIIIRTQAQFIGSTDRLRAFAALLDDTVRFFDAAFALLHEVDRGSDGAAIRFPQLAHSREADTVQPVDLLGALERVTVTQRHVRTEQAFTVDGAPAQRVATLVLPIQRDDVVIGVLTMVHAAGAFTDEDAQTAQPICALLAQLLEVWQTTQLRRQDQQSIARLSQVAQQMRSGIVITDAEGRIDWVNHAFLDEISMPASEVLGLQPAQICELLSVSTDEAIILASLLRRGEPFSGEFALIDRRTDRATWYEISGNPFINPAGQSEGLLIMMVDITERRRVERMKDDFISTVSHELRTPLTSIRGALSLLDAGAGGALPPAVAEMVSIAHRNSGRLGNLIDDLLDLDKLSSGMLRIDAQSHAIMPSIDETLVELQTYADSYGVQLRCSQRAEGARALVDPHRFQQVMRNLLSNAIKFSADGRAVDVLVEAGNEVLVHVVDQGIGIPLEFQSQVFQRFTQADNRAGLRIGTGLGLAISKDLVEGMGGRLTFRSIEGEGSTFTVTLVRGSDNA